MPLRNELIVSSKRRRKRTGDKSNDGQSGEGKLGPPMTMTDCEDFSLLHGGNLHWYHSLLAKEAHAGNQINHTVKVFYL